MVFVCLMTGSDLLLWAQPTSLPRADTADLSRPAEIPAALIIRDAHSIYWSFFAARYLGFDEVWVAYSHDRVNWSRGLYTGIPVLPGNSFRVRVSEAAIDADWFGPMHPPAERRYYRSSIDTTIWGYTIYKHVLYGDADADGLSDLAEDILWTDPDDPDTDGDGLADGYDNNPLAAPLDSLSREEMLHKAVIENELEALPDARLVIVEQLGDRPISYHRSKGIVLSLSPQACDAYVEAHGYGVPILTCNAAAAAGDRLKASFQFFIAPDDAWGYETTFQWEEEEKELRSVGPIDSWRAEPE